MADEEVVAARPQVMPVFMGAPWAQRYGGPGSELPLQDWKTQTEYLAGLQGLSDVQKTQFVLGSLEGEAKREVLAAPSTARATAKAIFDFLTGLYGDTTPVAALRAQFFNFRQGPRQALRAYALRLREQFVRLKGRPDHGLGDGDSLLRDQFVLGLRDGPIRQSIKLQLRRDPALTFEDLRQEALALEMDQGEAADPPVCMAVGGAAPSSTGDWKQQLRAELLEDVKGQMCMAVGEASTPPTMDWKQKLRAELFEDVKGQMAELSKTLLEELRRGQLSGRDRSYSEGSREPGLRPGRPANPRFQWDDKGRPICNSCGESGHYSRQCGSRRGSQGGF